MDFGVNGAPRGAMRTREGAMAVAQAAERLGFGFISMSDHVVVPRANVSRYPYNEEGKMGAAQLGHCFDQLTTLAFLAGCTSRIRLMTSVMVVPHRPPVLTAKVIATADVLSGGRMIVGCGAGWLREEFEALETRPFDARGRVTDEYIEAFKELWTKETPAYAGHHVKFADIVFEPKPLQKPHPPLWIGGESGPALRRVVKYGDAWYPGSRNPENRLDTPERLQAGVIRVKAMAATIGRDPATLGVSYAFFAPVDWKPHKGHDTPRRLFSGASADMAADAAALAGIGVGAVNLTFQTASEQETIERMQRFAEEVMPLVR